VTSHNLEEHCAQRPHISHSVVRFLEVHLWCHVQRSATNCVFEKIPALLYLCLAEVCDFKLKLFATLALYKDVFEFDISVHNLAFVLHVA
jgi:hypothetical protein